MSSAGELEHSENLKAEDSQEPFKKRFKSQVTAADLCKVVIDNNSTDEEMSDNHTSSGEDQSEIDSSEESENEQDAGTEYTAHWHEQLPTDHPKADYKDLAGLKVPPLGSQPRDFFNLMMNKSMYNLIIKNTNAYATGVVNDGHDAKIAPWKPLREDEMKKFLGLLFLMDVVRLPNFKFYWNTDRLFNFTPFRQIMSMDRFLAIFNALHFCDDGVSDVADPIRNIRPLIEFFNILMESIYTPQKILVMSNPMCIGKNNMKERLQVFTLCEPCGMVQKYLVIKNTRGDSLTSRHRRSIAASNLLEGKLGRGHSVFMGDYFTSISLIQSLKAENTYGTGQLSQRSCKDSSGPSNNKVFQRFTEDGICLLKWNDTRKNIICVSSEYNGSFAKTNISEQKQVTPPILIEYKRLFRQETNRLKHLVASYPAGKKRLKWYKKAGLQIINIIMINSYYLYSQYAHTKKMSLLKFKLNLIRTLLYSNTDTGEAASYPENGGTSTKPHVLDYVGRNDKGFRKRKRCKYCISERGVRVDSYYHCITCDNQPGFCLGQCFIKYHKYDTIL